jgi:hypothetical protein
MAVALVVATAAAAASPCRGVSLYFCCCRCQVGEHRGGRGTFVFEECQNPGRCFRGMRPAPVSVYRGYLTASSIFNEGFVRLG